MLTTEGNKIVSVILAGTSAALIADQNDNEVSVVVAHADVNVGDVVMRADTGAVITKEDGWKYLERGVISSVVPAAGQFDALVPRR